MSSLMSVLRTPDPCPPSRYIGDSDRASQRGTAVPPLASGGFTDQGNQGRQVKDTERRRPHRSTEQDGGEGADDLGAAVSRAHARALRVPKRAGTATEDDKEADCSTQAKIHGSVMSASATNCPPDLNPQRGSPKLWAFPLMGILSL